MKLPGGKRQLDGLNDEIRQFIDRETEDNMARGLSPEEARYAAARKFGNPVLVLEDTRAVWSVVWIEQLMQDVRRGLRTMRMKPGFAAAVILTLALGIGMNTAVFSVVNAVLLRPLNYPDADRLVWLANYEFRYEKRDIFVPRPTYFQWKERSHVFESMTGYGNQDLALMADGESSQERIASVSGDFWSMVGARTIQGRLFGVREEHAIVLSYGLFQRRFGGDPRVVGKAIDVSGYPFTVIGVLPAGFRFLFPQQYYRGDEMREMDAYIPFPDALMRLPVSANRQWDEFTRASGPAPYNVRVVAKLKPGVTMAKARAEMEITYARTMEESRRASSDPQDGLRLHFASLKEVVAGDAGRSLFVLTIGVGFVLLIACANIANLLLSRASTQNREAAIRTAIGASGVRLLRQLLTESLLLALIGGTIGLFVARAAIVLMVRIAPQAVPRLEEANLDSRVLGFTLAASLAAGVLFGLGPALTALRGDLSSILKSDAGTTPASAGRMKIRGLLVTAEVSLAVVLLTGAGLMLKSFWRMNSNAPGFTPEKILALRVPLSGPQYIAWPTKAGYIAELLRRVEAAPGVLAAGIETTTFNISVKVGDWSDVATVRMVSTGYLHAIGVPLVKGKWPTDRDALNSVMVNESFARRVDSGNDVTGLRIGGSFLSGTISGVVADLRYRQLDAAASPEIYYPYERSPATRSIRVLIRTSGDAAALAPGIRRLVSRIDPSQPVYELRTLEQALSDAIAPRRFNMFLLGTFAAAALLMALMGIYGVIAYSVAQRTHEIGTRMALGAGRGEIVRMVIRHGMVFALGGIALGLGAALGLTRLMASLLYDVKPTDPEILAAVAATLAVTALVACWLPALRAALVDPAIALRYE